MSARQTFANYHANWMLNAIRRYRRWRGVDEYQQRIAMKDVYHHGRLKRMMQ